MTQAHPSEAIVQEDFYERILRQVQGIERDAEYRIHHDEKRSTRYSGRMPHLWDQNVQDWQGQLTFRSAKPGCAPDTRDGFKLGDGD
jgi:hypothetical protein